MTGTAPRGDGPPRTILFVDDDANLLSGLHRLLRSRPPGCELIFAGSGAEALDVMASTSLDAVFSDMRMPHMDGATLLGLARQLAPSAVRVVLSGQMSADAALRAAGVAHRFLDKPVAAGVLRSTIDEILASQRQVTGTHDRALLGGAQCLSSPAATCAALVAALEEGGDVPAVVRAVGGDLGIVSKTVQVASTSFFGPGGGVDSEPDAFRRVGVDNLRAMVAARLLAVPAPEPLGELAAQLAAHSRRVMRLADALIGGADRALRLACLLHDLGVFAGPCLGVTEQVGPTNPPAPAQVAQYLLGVWGIPAPVRELIAAAQQVADGERPCSQPIDGGTALALADALDAERCALPGHDQRVATLGEALDPWRERARQLDKESP